MIAAYYALLGLLATGLLFVVAVIILGEIGDTRWWAAGRAIATGGIWPRLPVGIGLPIRGHILAVNIFSWMWWVTRRPFEAGDSFVSVTPDIAAFGAALKAAQPFEPSVDIAAYTGHVQAMILKLAEETSTPLHFMEVDPEDTSAATFNALVAPMPRVLEERRTHLASLFSPDLLELFYWPSTGTPIYQQLVGEVIAGRIQESMDTRDAIAAGGGFPVRIR